MVSVSTLSRVMVTQIDPFQVVEPAERVFDKSTKMTHAFMTGMILSDLQHLRGGIVVVFLVRWLDIVEVLWWQNEAEVVQLQLHGGGGHETDERTKNNVPESRDLAASL